MGMLIAPVILLPDWKRLYGELIDFLADVLDCRVRAGGFIEIILMTYSFVQNAINQYAFPGGTQLLDREIMTGRGKGKYCYQQGPRAEAEALLRERLAAKLPGMQIQYVS